MCKRLICLSILALLASGIAAAADHNVFVNGSYQNGWGNSNGTTLTTFGGETVLQCSNASAWFWRGASNSSAQDVSTCGYWEYEIYCTSTGGGDQIEWHRVEPSDWGGTNFKTGCSVDGSPVSLPRNLGFDAWHKVSFDMTVQSWWGTTSPSVRYLKWQFPEAGTCYIRNIKFIGAPNQSPTADAGGDQVITLPDYVTLDGTAGDDGQPNPLTTLWEKASGPGTVAFGDANAVDTTASFSMHGTYALRLSAYDGEFTVSDEMLVSVFSEDGIITNEGAYPNNEVPKYKKFEVTFLYDANAQNPQLPYDDDPPAGLDPNIGVSVDGLFTPDNWTTTYTQPGFYYKDFTYALKANQDWWYPTGEYYWKIRFAPDQTGTWKYKIRTEDSDGINETAELSFVVCDSNEKGFLKVSETDERYFEFENGDPFIGLGHNIRFGYLSWNNPVKDNTTLFAKFNSQGTQFFRTWLSHWSIYGSTWTPWNSPLNSQHGTDPPWNLMSSYYADPNSEVSVRLTWPGSPAIFMGWLTGKKPPIKRNTDYHFSVRYKIPILVDGPRIAGYPYGLVAKVTPNWLDDNNNDVYKYCDPDELRTDGKVVTVVTSYGNTWTGNYEIIEGTWNSGSYDYLPYVYVVLENVSTVVSGVHIDKIEIREDLGGGQYGPCINGKSWMAHHLFMDQHKSWAFDKVVELAEEYDIYLKLVLSEKNEWIGSRITPAGYISDSANPNNFYGEYRTLTKGRWLQQAWWRYCQARWGYSTHIQSWELCNEGDPWNDRHYTLTDEMGIYMHQYKNKHLVTTSFWHSWPKDGFWANPSYPNVDFADFHIYETPDDCAQNTRAWSEWYGAKAPQGAGKPMVRGETGFGAEVMDDTESIWMHNFAWGMINPGGMYDHYWDNDNEFSNVTPDPRRHFRPYRNFMEGIPLNNGLYEDANTVVSIPTSLRAWGQKDLTNGNAHLWIQNMKHTWRNIVDGNPMPPVSGTVDIGGFVPYDSYVLQWWDTYQADVNLQITGTQRIKADATGNIRLTITDLATDVAVKVLNTTGDGDVDGDNDVDGHDLETMASQWLQTPGTPSADIAPPPGGDDFVNLLDFALLADKWLATY